MDGDVNGIAALVDRVTQRVNTASDRVAYQMTMTLRTSALYAGWPSDIANLLEVEHRNGQYVPTWPRSINEAVRDLEYGITNDEPNPVLRRFANRVQGMAEKRLNKELA